LKQINEYKTFWEVTKDDDLKQYQKIPYNIVYDVKFDLRKKARLVANGNHASPTKDDIYSGVVAMDTIRLAFQLAAMNGLSCCAADVGNAFLYGKTNEKVYIVAGAEFGELEGQSLIVDKGLYGLRSSSARFHEHLAAKLRLMNYVPSKADSDLWMKDMGTHYEYIATYVDDILAFGKDPMSTITELKKHCILKGVGEPEYLLGGNVEQLDEHWIKEGIFTALSAETYIGNVLEKLNLLFGGDISKARPIPPQDGRLAVT
jgi:hypothetical protein